MRSEDRAALIGAAYGVVIGSILTAYAAYAIVAM